MTKHINPLVFIHDLNGCLSNNFLATLKATNAVLAYCGMPMCDEEQYRSAHAKPPIIIYQKLGLDIQFLIAQKEVLKEIWEEEYWKNESSIVLRKGAEEFLRETSKLGLRHIVLSNADEREVLGELERHNIYGYFESIIARKTATEVYGESQKLHNIMNYAKANHMVTSRALFIGDTIEEKDLADKMGASCALFIDGCTSKDKLMAIRSAFLVQDYKELFHKLKKLAR